MKRTSVVAFVALIIGGLPCVVLGQGTAESRYEYVGEHAGWVLARFVDTFDDTPTSWLTYTQQGESAQLNLVCWGGDDYGFVATADGETLTGPSQTKIKIDGNSVIEAAVPGGYNVFMADDHVEIREVLRQMRVGEEVRIRITTSNGTHTFRLPLLGFREASDWVFRECNVTFEEQTDAAGGQDQSN